MTTTQTTEPTSDLNLAIRAYNALSAATEQPTAAEWDAVAARLEAYLPVLSGDRHEFVRARAADARSHAKYQRLSHSIN